MRDNIHVTELMIFQSCQSLLPLNGVVQGQDWAAAEPSCRLALSAGSIRLCASLYLDLELKRSVTFVQHL